MPLIKCDINLNKTWSANCVISEWNRQTTFKIRDTQHYAPVVTLSTKDYYSNWHQDFKGTINCNKYQSKATIPNRNLYLDYLIETSFQRLNRTK